jgi:APA family basic amino acid/polyamine antiporter
MSWVNIVATIATVAGLGLVVVLGLPAFDFAALTTPPEDQSIRIGVSAGAALVFFSFVGFEDLVGSAEETTKPKATVPKALLIGQVVVLVVYLLVAVSAVSLMAPGKLAEQDGPLSAVAESAAGRWAAITLTIIALFATSKTIMTNMMGASRLLMDMGRDVAWLSVFRRVLPKVHTPGFAVGLLFVATTAFALIGNLKLVATISNFAVYAVYLTVNFALIKLRLDSTEHKPAFRVPLSVGNVPVPTVLAIVTLLYLVGFNIRNLLVDG